MGILEYGSRGAPAGASRGELVAAAGRAAEANRTALMGKFLRAHVVVETDSDRGARLVLHEVQGARWVHAYTDPEFLPGARWGQEDIWSVTVTGAQLLARRDREAPGAGIRLDHGHHHAVDIELPTAPPAPTAAAGTAERGPFDTEDEDLAEDGWRP